MGSEGCSIGTHCLLGFSRDPRGSYCVIAAACPIRNLTDANATSAWIQFHRSTHPEYLYYCLVNQKSNKFCQSRCTINAISRPTDAITFAVQYIIMTVYYVAHTNKQDIQYLKKSYVQDVMQWCGCNISISIQGHVCLFMHVVRFLFVEPARTFGKGSSRKCQSSHDATKNGTYGLTVL